MNYMTGTYSNFLKNYGTRNNTVFTDSFEEKISAAYSEKTAKAEEKSAAEMSMEEYKRYIHDKISQIPINPSQSRNSIAINISEAGFEAMKNDPKYEEWVIDKLREDFAFNDPWSGVCGGHYVVHYFGASKSEYLGQSWYPEYMGGKGEDLFNSKSQNSFWERRVEREKMIKKQQQKAAMRKKELEEYYKKMTLKRENYTRFLEGKKLKPEPMVSAAELLKAINAYSGFGI